MSALGETFRTTRESQGLSLSDVAERIHIRSVYLAAIEAEDWNAIGPAVYVRGFVRSYARSLGLDPDAAIAQFAGQVGGATAPAATPRASAQRIERSDKQRTAAPPPSSPDPRRPGLSLGALAGVLVALALVVFVGYQYFEYAQSASGPARPGGAAPAEPPAQPPATEPGSHRPTAPPENSRAATQTEERTSAFAVRLRDSSWLRVVVDGKLAMQGTYPKGTLRSFAGRAATVRVGNAGGVDIFVDGKDLGPMGGLGDVAERSYQL